MICTSWLGIFALGFAGMKNERWDQRKILDITQGQ